MSALVPAMVPEAQEARVAQEVQEVQVVQVALEVQEEAAEEGVAVAAQ